MIFPDYIGRTSFDMTSERVLVSSESRNKKVLTRSLTGQRFDVRMRCFVKPWDTLKAAGWLELMQQDGVDVTYTDESWIKQQGSIANKTVGGGGSSIGSNQVTLNSSAGVFVGALLNFSGQDKLYKVLNISGNVITVNTGLQSALASGTAVIFNEPKITLELAPELKRSIGLSQGLEKQLATFNLRLHEVLV